jgi:hypothetical protein
MMTGYTLGTVLTKTIQGSHFAIINIILTLKIGKVKLGE